MGTDQYKEAQGLVPRRKVRNRAFQAARARELALECASLPQTTVGYSSSFTLNNETTERLLETFLTQRYSQEWANVTYWTSGTCSISVACGKTFQSFYFTRFDKQSSSNARP